MLHKLEFSKNWNEKLNNTIFQAIRKKNHPIKMGDQVDIYIQGKYMKRFAALRTFANANKVCEHYYANGARPLLYAGRLAGI
jgi:hypothetical protein